MMVMIAVPGDGGLVPLWHFFWPLYVACLALGLLTGILAFKGPAAVSETHPARTVSRLTSFGRNRRAVIALGGVMALVLAMLWYFPLGAAERMSNRIEAITRLTLDYYELQMVRARLDRRPLTRRLILSGPADEFQRRELVRILDQVPGVANVAWDPASVPAEGV